MIGCDASVCAMQRWNRQRIHMNDWIIDAVSAKANLYLLLDAHLTEPEHTAPAQPPGRRHGRQVGRAVGIQGADESYGGSEVKNGRLNCLVHGPRICER